MGGWVRIPWNGEWGHFSRRFFNGGGMENLRLGYGTSEETLPFPTSPPPMPIYMYDFQLCDGPLAIISQLIWQFKLVNDCYINFMNIYYEYFDYTIRLCGSHPVHHPLTCVLITCSLAS